MGLKSCMGRYALTICCIAFSLGVLISTVSPSWIGTSFQDPITQTTLEVEFGPFYSRNRTCAATMILLPAASATTTYNEDQEDEDQDCSDWTQNEIDIDDCNSFTIFFQDDEATRDKICRQHTSWRVLAMFCLFIVIGTAIMVGVATCTQCVTCGCCGGSFDMIAMIAYWVEVVFSIAAWSLCISVVSILRDSTIQDVLQAEAENVVNNLEQVTDLIDGNFLWGFWLFLFSGTVLGAVCATLADWASEGSCLRYLFSCLSSLVSCLCCCKKNKQDK